MVAVTRGGVDTLEMATRSKIQLILILVERENGKRDYAKYQKYFQDAADKGLVQLSINASANQSPPK